MKINLLDLFSGIGGFSLGLSQAGFDIDHHFFSEIDIHAIATYKHKFNGAIYAGSVTDVRGSELPRIDAITFGSPCQDFSLAGKRKGLSGERSSLIGEAIRLIRETRPQFFIWENVKGAFSSNNSADFWAIIQEFANIGGYRLEWQLLNTTWFLPQNRERIYLVGYSANGCGRSIFPIGEDVEFSQSSCRKTRSEVGNAKCLSVSSGKGNLDSNYVKCIQRPRYGEGVKESDVCPTIEASRFEQKTHVKIGSMRGRNPDNPKSRVAGLPTEQMLEFNENGTSNTLTSVQKDNYVCYDTPYSMGNSKPKRSCLNSTRTPEVGNQDHSIRRLTEIECERLQGFYDDYTKYGMYLTERYQKYIFGIRVQKASSTKNKQHPLHKSESLKLRILAFAINKNRVVEKELSATQRYKLLGNAVSVPVVKAVGERVLLVLNQSSGSMKKTDLSK